MKNENDRSDSSLDSMLIKASFVGNLREVRRLLSEGVSPNVCNEDADTPLILAAASGARKIILELLAAGADVNQRNNDGITALMYALKYKDYATLSVRNLLVTGIDHTLTDIRGYYTADYAMMAALRGSKVPEEISVDPLHLCVSWAARKGNALLLAEYLRNDLPRLILTNALVLAVKEGNEESCHLLIDKGADVNGNSIRGERPLTMAAGKVNLEVARLLIARGAEVDVRDSEGMTPLLKACSTFISEFERDDDRYILVELLIGKGADINAVDNEGNYPLHGDVELSVIILLLEHGADPFAGNEDGILPLAGRWRSPEDECKKEVVRRCLLKSMTEKDVEEALEC